MLLRDAIAIPEHVSASDFVLKLDAGVEHAATTVAEYVVTDSLAAAFDAALGSVKAALADGGDRGSFIHGSFGSGKSHFMAVLHLLLVGDPRARALPGLQGVIAQHEATLDAKVLALDFHLIGADSLEAALFGGYLRQVAARHPDAPTPVLHNTEPLFADAQAMRARLGDEAFFAGLSGSASSGWGSYAGGWTPETFDAAVHAPLGDDARGRLATALVSAYFSGYQRAGEWVGIDEGLAIIAAHAKALGYRAVVLFLDELVLWLASHLADTEFVSTEGSKVAKLVETGAGSRAVPIVSFVARQRDLMDFLGDSVAGAQRVAVGQTFTWWEDRFDTIHLAASDLPEIAHKRLLQPTSPEGAAALKAALARVKADARAWDDLRRDEQGADEAAFAKVYPFSPALVDTLVALSGLLQRERTALKVMAQILAKGRDILKVTDLIPVGDLYDVMVEGGDNPLTEVMRVRFTAARELYGARLRPMLLAHHQLTEDDVAGSRPGALAPDAPPTVAAFLADDRLAKTLIIAALAPGAASLRDLTASRLAYLNFGTVAAIIAGSEAMAVAAKVRQWAEQIGEIRVGSGADPIVTLDITGVDYDSILDRVRHEDTPAERRRLLRRMVFTQLGVSSDDTLLAENPHSVIWRGSKRRIDLVFGNIRDPDALPDDALRANGDTWKLVIDYPFDTAERTPHDDIARLERLQSSGVTSRTVAWIPKFLSATRQDDLGALVLLEHVLTGETFAQHSMHLATEHREPARTALTNRRDALRTSLAGVIRQAYGLRTADPRDVDLSFGDVPPFVSLDPGVSIRPPVAATLADALGGIADQMLSAQYPEHPRFEPGTTEVKRAELMTVVEYVQRAVAGGGRVDPVDQAKRGPLRRVSSALKIGEMHENHYVIDAATFPWRNRFVAWVAAEDRDRVPVARAREWLAPYGMTREVQNLLLMAWALLDDKQWLKSGAAITVTGVEQVSDDLELRDPQLPEVEAWAAAVERADQLFGVHVARLRSAANVATLAAGVRAKAREWQPGAVDLVAGLERHADVLGLTDDSARLATARLAAEMLARLAQERDDVVLVDLLYNLAVPNEPQALAKSMSSAASVAGSFRAIQWNLLDAVAAIDSADARRGDVDALQQALREAAAAHELHASLGQALHAAVQEAGRILALGTVVVDPPPIPPPPPPPPLPPLPAQVRTVDDIHLDDVEEVFSTVLAEAREELRRHPDKRLRVRWWLE